MPPHMLSVVVFLKTTEAVESIIDNLRLRGFSKSSQAVLTYLVSLRLKDFRPPFAINSAASAILGVITVAWVATTFAFLSLLLFSLVKARRVSRTEDTEASEIELSDLSDTRIHWIRGALHWLARLGGAAQRHDIDDMDAPQHNPSSDTSLLSPFDSVPESSFPSALYNVSSQDEGRADRTAPLHVVTSYFCVRGRTHHLEGSAQHGTGASGGDSTRVLDFRQSVPANCPSPFNIVGSVSSGDLLATSQDPPSSHRPHRRTDEPSPALTSGDSRRSYIESRSPEEDTRRIGETREDEEVLARTWTRLRLQLCSTSLHCPQSSGMGRSPRHGYELLHPQSGHLYVCPLSPPPSYRDSI
ncbi:hypothetical protein C8Q78DRAFT_717935 [Trametes maxima]|nr:hypothetical protein C8Q78DRAFT_717935 [Trametes maxima]